MNMMPQYVTENIFCSEVSAQRSRHPLHFRYKTKAESEGERCPTRSCCS